MFDACGLAGGEILARERSWETPVMRRSVQMGGLVDTRKLVRGGLDVC